MVYLLSCNINSDNLSSIDTLQLALVNIEVGLGRVEQLYSNNEINLKEEGNLKEITTCSSFRIGYIGTKHLPVQGFIDWNSIG